MKPACRITHSQISAGTCPWCESPVGDGDSMQTSLETVWNIAAVSAALDDPDAEVRLMTVTNIFRDGPPAVVAVPLLAKALADPVQEIRRDVEHGLTHLGQNLTADDVRRIEQQIPHPQHELGLRILALGYYFIGQRESVSALDKRHQHIFWLISNAPNSESAGSPEASIQESVGQAYETAKNLWLAQIDSHPEDTKVLGNAARFFLIHDRELSETLLKKACDLEPANPEWSERLGQLYSLGSGRKTPESQVNARHALREYRRAERIRSEAETGDAGTCDPEVKKTQQLLERINYLPHLAAAAYDARELQVAKNYATELLSAAASSDLPEFFRNDGNAIHHGNLVLGKVALQNGDLDQARERLIACAGTTGSPQLGSFGPNMSLAKELLERGERDVVLEFFELCAKFWEHGSDTLMEWTHQVRAGEMPDFGGNLRY
ncbi:MAG TPA: hypothetical protein VGM05_11100 [Planctomycetaceae bacterium]